MIFEHRRTLTDPLLMGFSPNLCQSPNAVPQMLRSGEGELASVLIHEDTATDPDELFYEGTSPGSQEMYF